MPARPLLTTTLSYTQKHPVGHSLVIFKSVLAEFLHPTSHQRPLPCSSCTYTPPATYSVIPLTAEPLKPSEESASLLEKNSESRTVPFMLLMPTEALLWIRANCTRKSEPADPAAIAPVPLPVPLAPVRSTQLMEIPLPSARSRLSEPLPSSLTTGAGCLAGPTEVGGGPGSPLSLSPALRVAWVETGYSPASTQDVVAVSGRSPLIALSISSPL